MTTDLWMLVYTSLMSMFFFFAYLPGRSLVPGGTAWAFGNRDTSLEVPAWTARAVRAHANLVENLGPFAVLVLVAHVAMASGAMTALVQSRPLPPVFGVAQISTWTSGRAADTVPSFQTCVSPT